MFIFPLSLSLDQLTASPYENICFFEVAKTLRSSSVLRSTQCCHLADYGWRLCYRVFIYKNVSWDMYVYTSCLRCPRCAIRYNSQFLPKCMLQTFKSCLFPIHALHRFIHPRSSVFFAFNPNICSYIVRQAAFRFLTNPFTIKTVSSNVKKFRSSCTSLRNHKYISLVLV